MVSWQRVHIQIYSFFPSDKLNIFCDEFLGLQVDELYDKLKSLPNSEVYLKNDIPDRYHYKDNKRIAPIVVLPNIGYMVQTNGSYPYSDSLSMF